MSYKDLRIGQGYDCHRFSSLPLASRPFILGGVVIPGSQGLDGHSDADVLLHAIIDALLGASSLGDIGEHFPDTSADFKDISSISLLKNVWNKVKLANWEIINIDSTVCLEKPKLQKYKAEIEDSIARVLSVSPDIINIKATTSEKMGFVGREEGVFAISSLLLGRKS